MNDTNSTIIVTYILRSGNKFYVGKTNNLDRRMSEHKKDRWSMYLLVWAVMGDYEYQIKSFGVAKFYGCINKELVS